MPRPVQALALLYLGVGSAVIGVWAQFFPQGFYQRFPGFGVWVAGDGPYNEHLIRDVGGLNLGLAVLALLALWRPAWVSARAVGGAALIYGLPHLIYHLAHLDMLPSRADQWGSASGLFLWALGSALLLLTGPQRAASRLA